jgi:probable F420-dependent oxidoreductase
MTPTLTVGLANFGPPHGGSLRAMVDLARLAEDAGVDRVNVVDHVVMGPHTDAYTWGRFPTPADAIWNEPLTVLAAMATITSTLRLSTGILIAPLRPAALLAKTVATLDQLANGRIDLGVGIGWQREEYEAVGLDFEQRGQLLDDTIGACRALWAQMPAEFSSSSVSFTETYCSPQPVQPRLPVWFSGVLIERNVRRVVELGDGWIPIMGATIDDVAAGTARLRTEYAAAGRDPASLSVQVPVVMAKGDNGFDIDATMASVPHLVEAGATTVYINLRAFDPAGDAPGETMSRMVTAFHREI